MATAAVAGPAPLSPAVARSPFFHMPHELRAEVYEFIFSDSPIPPNDNDDAASMPVSSELGQLRLVSRQTNQEARKTFLLEVIHVINWDPERVARQPNVYMDRISSLGEDALQQIKHIAFRITNGNVDYIDPLHLDIDPDYVDPGQHRVIRRGLQLLESVTIVLDLPYIETIEGRETRIRQESNLANKISLFTHVNKLIIQNIFHRTKFPYCAETGEQHWTILEWEDDSDIVNDDR
ncbi:hypothetical protein T440DRAFT_463023 [Plenodomus tracheiphilus IPT5]|uniref:F-box domain-containing protein n=1 Tax=Plenodomus tracheiphilus IPT5 TaxID=1408161 RepID=A0A6A7BQ27_9PLEO|nr:hypothetical protein T440DRAFT_463023 [Plenodomus tracheiphilus IPT5]